MNINQKIAEELQVSQQQVQAAIGLLDEGATVPFIARYRKEVTGGLTDAHLRTLEERLHYLRELVDRKQAILKSIAEQNKLTPELEKCILATDNKAHLEDLYLPYKPKRRTKAQIAREAGLEPLALKILSDQKTAPQQLATPFVNVEHGITTEAEALDGARHILMETFSEQAELLAALREYVWQHSVLTGEVIKGREQAGIKFSDYFNYQEPIKKVPSHRALALFRGQQEEMLKVKLLLSDAEQAHCIAKIKTFFSLSSLYLEDVATQTWRIKLLSKIEVDLLMQLRELAEKEAIKVFANNLKHLLMASPAGMRITLGLDPGLRTGIKVVVIDATGKLLIHTAIFPHQPRNDWDASIDVLAKLCAHYKVELVSIGNGTASRETDKLVTELKKKHPELKLTSIVVSEAGASVYSASELASQEFPELDVSYRGAVSIARRLQDPLAELVKIDPKSIGVGQYQHDVSQIQLSRTLHAVVEDCVNAVGVDVNTASVPLLARVAGLSEAVAKNIVSFRDQNGAFRNRNQLKKIPRLGEKTYEQAAGFLRIVNGENPLDASAVHPEAYAVVERILNKQSKSIHEVMGNKNLLKSLKAQDYVDAQFGLTTVSDILLELEKPGRDPRPEFKTAAFKEGIESIKDLKSDMVLEGVVTNVANFGAFVDVGAHQDGLVHKSMMANYFVRDPNEVVKVGDIVKVKVIEVDLERKRIQLTMRLTDSPAKSTLPSHAKPVAKSIPKKAEKIHSESAFGSALLHAIKKKD